MQAVPDINNASHASDKMLSYVVMKRISKEFIIIASDVRSCMERQIIVIQLYCKNYD